MKREARKFKRRPKRKKKERKRMKAVKQTVNNWVKIAGWEATRQRKFKQSREGERDETRQ